MYSQVAEKKSQLNKYMSTMTTTDHVYVPIIGVDPTATTLNQKSLRRVSWFFFIANAYIFRVTYVIVMCHHNDNWNELNVEGTESFKTIISITELN